MNSDLPPFVWCTTWIPEPMDIKAVTYRRPPGHLHLLHRNGIFNWRSEYMRLFSELYVSSNLENISCVAGNLRSPGAPLFVLLLNILSHRPEDLSVSPYPKRHGRHQVQSVCSSARNMRLVLTCRIIATARDPYSSTRKELEPSSGMTSTRVGMLWSDSCIESTKILYVAGLHKAIDAISASH